MDTSASHLAHGLLTTRLPSDLLSRFYYSSPLPDDQVSLTWLGTAGFRLEHRGKVLLLDPFVSRPGLRQSVLRRLEPDARAISRHAPRADTIVCGHSHHDHVMDVPHIAQATGAVVLGSSSSYNLCRSHGLPESQLVQLQAPQTVEVGPFRITVRPSTHTPGMLDRMLGGRILPGARSPLRLRQYRSDITFGVLVEVGDLGGGGRPLRLFHLSSAAYLPETTEGLRCDVLLPAIVARQHSPDFTRDLLAALQPGLVIPHHFDDFFAPMDTPARQMPRADVEGFLSEVQRCGVPATALVLRKLGAVRVTLDGSLVVSEQGVQTLG